ncbi:hypothetical protein HK405_008757, partial [Cladochytrium tenue]
MIPNFCGLPGRALIELSRAFEKQQAALARKQAEEAERAERARIEQEAAVAAELVARGAGTTTSLPDSAI